MALWTAAPVFPNEENPSQSLQPTLQAHPLCFGEQCFHQSISIKSKTVSTKGSCVRHPAKLLFLMYFHLSSTTALIFLSIYQMCFAYLTDTHSTVTHPLLASRKSQSCLCIPSGFTFPEVPGLLVLLARRFVLVLSSSLMPGSSLALHVFLYEFGVTNSE